MKRLTIADEAPQIISVLSLPFRPKERDEAHGDGGLSLDEPGVALAEVCLIGRIAAVFRAHQQSGCPFVLIGRGELVQSLSGSRREALIVVVVLVARDQSCIWSDLT